MEYSKKNVTKFEDLIRLIQNAGRSDESRRWKILPNEIIYSDSFGKIVYDRNGNFLYNEAGPIGA